MLPSIDPSCVLLSVKVVLWSGRGTLYPHPRNQPVTTLFDRLSKFTVTSLIIIRNLNSELVAVSQGHATRHLALDMHGGTQVVIFAFPTD